MNAKTFSVLTLLTTSAVAAWARVTVDYGAKQMFDDADVVVKAEVLNTKSNGKAQFSEADLKDPLFKNHVAILNPDDNVATVQVQRIIKGNIPEGSLNVHFYSSKTQSLLQLSPKEEVLLFLKRRDGGLFLVDIDNGKLPATGQESKNTPPDAKGRMIDELRFMTSDSSPSVVKAGLEGLDQFPEVDSTDIFMKFSQDDRPEIRSRAIAARVKRGDKSAEAEMLSILKSDQFNSPSKNLEDQRTKMQFFDSINQMGKSGDPSEVSKLLELVDNNDRGIRIWAIGALRRIKSPASVPALVKLIDDKDQFVQYLAVMTLCEMNSPGGKGCPSTILFNKSPANYRAQWKDWWAKQQNKK